MRISLILDWEQVVVQLDEDPTSLAWITRDQSPSLFLFTCASLLFSLMRVFPPHMWGLSGLSLHVHMLSPSVCGYYHGSKLKLRLASQNQDVDKTSAWHVGRYVKKGLDMHLIWSDGLNSFLRHKTFEVVLFFPYVNDTCKLFIYANDIHMSKWYTCETHFNVCQNHYFHVQISTSNSFKCIGILGLTKKKKKLKICEELR